MKPIRISHHASQRALQRGARIDEIENCIRSSPWNPAQNNKYSANMAFSFESVSPVNGKYYDLKTIEAIFIEEHNEIVVVTVKVYYLNR